VVSSIRRYRCCILMYFEFDPNFTSEVIQKNIRLQFDRRETGNKIKFLHILKPGGIVYAEKLYTN
jgi:hypothetical protein